MSPTRREFISWFASLAAYAGGSRLHAAKTVSLPTPRAAALMAAFDVTYPIFQAGMGGSVREELTAAVSNAGGLGILPLTGATPEVARARVEKVRSTTRRPFAVNYLLHRDPVTLPQALDAGAPIVQFAWGLPSIEHVRAIRARDTRFGVQVSSAAGARRALDLGADFLICQGIEAGGHVQATDPLEDIFGGVRREAGRVHVLAAGGIADGRAIRRWLLAGASGVLIGTRFVATKEAIAHDVYKDALVRATAGDTVYTVCFQDGWPNAPHRTLRNSTFTTWEAAGSPPPGQRPQEGEVLATTAEGRQIKRYSSASPHRGMTGKLTELALYAGTGVGAIRDVPSAAVLVERLWAEARSGDGT